MAIGSSTLAASSTEYTKQVIQKNADEIVMEVLPEDFNIKYKDGDSGMKQAYLGKSIFP